MEDCTLHSQCSQPRASHALESRAQQTARTAPKWLGLDDELARSLLYSTGPNGELALDLVAVAQLAYVAKSLRRLVKSRSIGRRWINGPNTGIGMRPIALLRTAGGLELLHDYMTQFEPR